MEDWLKTQKLNEAYKITKLRDDKGRQAEINNDARQFDNNNTKSYKQWVRQSKF